MLENDPPPGTRVQITEDILRKGGLRTLKRDEMATLVAAGRYSVDRPSDLFQVRFEDGEVVRVRRDGLRALGRR